MGTKAEKLDDAQVDRKVVVARLVAKMEEEGAELPDAAMAICRDALEELVELRLPLFDLWYLANVYRYYKTTRETERAAARVIVRRFLAAVQTGEIAL